MSGNMAVVTSEKSRYNDIPFKISNITCMSKSSQRGTETLF